METGAVELLERAIDALAAEVVQGCAQRDGLARLTCLQARLDAQIARRIVEFDQTVEWSVDGAKSAAGWFAAHARMSSGEAHHRVKVARQAAAMPLVARSWQSGAISTRHVDAVARVRHAAKADAEFAVFEPVLVDVALEGRPEDIANVGKQWRDALDNHLNRDGAEKISEQQHDRRDAKFARSFEGIGFLDGTFDVEGAEIVEDAIQRVYDQHHVADDPRSPGQQRADAIVEICRHYLDHQGRGANRPHLMVVVDDATLAGEAVGRCETINGYRISPDAARRIGCDAIWQRVIVDAKGIPLEMGHATRTFTPDQHRAIMLRDGGCRFPGCDARPEHCEAHHSIYWEDGGLTNLADGIAICRGRGHHRLIHEGGWTIHGNPNCTVTFHDPNGTPMGTSEPRNAPRKIPTRLGDEIELARQRVRELRSHAA